MSALSRLIQTELPTAEGAPIHASAAASWVTLGYMLLALAPLAVSAPSHGAGWRVLVVHLCVMAALAAALRSSRSWAGVARAWLPLAAIPLLYAQLPYLIASMGAPFGDSVVQRWEQAAFGGQPARTLAGSAPLGWLSELLHLSYLSYYAIIYVPFAVLFYRGRTQPRHDHHGVSRVRAKRAFGEAALAVMMTFVLCFAAFAVFPVQGPRFLWPAPAGVPPGPIRGLVLHILEQGSSRGAAFPSSHMAVAVVQGLMAMRWRVPGRALIVLATLGIGVGAVYGGFHYAIDMVAGAALGACVFLAVRRWSTGRAAAAGQRRR